MNVDLKSFTPAALQCLMGYGWPGNNRQLENEVKPLIAFARGKLITEENLDPSIRNLDTPAPVAQEVKQPTPAPVAPPYTNPAGIRRRVRTQHDRSSPPQIRRQQTKSGPGFRPEPPEVG